MRRLTFSIAMLGLMLAAESAFAQNFTTVTASNIQDVSGAKLANGSLCFDATDANNQEISFQAGGGGQVIRGPICTTVTNGAIGTFQVPNSSNTSPAGVVYHVYVVRGSYHVLDYYQVAVTGSTWNFDSYSPTANVPLPPTGGSVNGPLTVNGNLSVTGSSTLPSIGNGASPIALTSPLSGFQDKGGQVFNVKAYGATGNGTTDDTTAIQNAINAACAVHGTAFFPPGNYVISSPINITGVTNCRLEGSNPGTSDQGFGTNASTILWKGSSTTNAALDFSNSFGMYVDRLGFSYSSSTSQPGAAMLFNSASSGWNRLTDVSLAGGSVADLVSCGSESLSVDGQSFLDVAPQYGIPRGALLSSNGCSGYSITSAFTSIHGATSETRFRFTNVNFQYNGGDNAHSIELDGTGSGLPIDNVFIEACYFPAGGSTSSSNAAIYIRGTAINMSVITPRYEINSTTGAYKFIDLASGATLRDFSILGYDTSNSGGSPSIYGLYSEAANATIQTGTVYGTSFVINAGGSMNDVSVHDINPLSVTFNGTISGGDFYGNGGNPTWNVTSYNVKLQGTPNVVYYNNGTTGTYNLPGSGTYDGAVYRATKEQAVCQFLYSDALLSGNNTVIVAGQVTAIGNATPSTVTCPANGTYSAGQSITFGGSDSTPMYVQKNP